MYIIVLEVTNYTNEQLLLLQLLGRRVASPQFSCSLAPSHRFPLYPIVALESWAFSLRVQFNKLEACNVSASVPSRLKRPVE